MQLSCTIFGVSENVMQNPCLVPLPCGHLWCIKSHPPGEWAQWQLQSSQSLQFKHTPALHHQSTPAHTSLPHLFVESGLPHTPAKLTLRGTPAAKLQRCSTCAFRLFFFSFNNSLSREGYALYKWSPLWQMWVHSWNISHMSCRVLVNHCTIHYKTFYLTLWQIHYLHHILSTCFFFTGTLVYNLTMNFNIVRTPVFLLTASFFKLLKTIW